MPNSARRSAQVEGAGVDDAVPAAGPGPRDVGWQVVDEQALLRGTAGQMHTVLEKAAPGLRAPISCDRTTWSNRRKLWARSRRKR